MKKRSKLRKGLAVLLTATMVVGLIPDMGIMKVSAEGAYNENGFADDGSYEPATLTTGTYDIDGNGENDNVYEIGNAGQLYWFAGLVNGTLTDVTQDTSASAVLTQDITVNTGVLDGDGKLTSNPSSFTDWTPIGIRINGNDIKYTGTFDGKGYTISGLYFAGSTARLGFFGYVGSGGSVSNVGIVDSYFSGEDYAGGVCGVNSGSVTNCYHTGVVSGTTYVGGVCGANSGSVTNCYHTGAVSGSNTGGVCGVNDSSGNITNCYYETMDDIAGGIKGSDVTGKAQGKAKEAFNEGVVAYLLSHGSIDGSIWGQTLTEEAHQAYPVLGGTAVYRICKNGGASYSNHDGESVHQYDNGICSGCGVYKVPAYENDCYQIANKGNLYWFAGLVNGDASVCTGDVTQDTSASAVLTNDITVNTGVLDNEGTLARDTTGFISWTPIGNVINGKHVMYTGTFDGKGHTISGLYYAGSTFRLGFFGYVGSGGSVSNVGIVDSYFNGDTYAGGVCGDNRGSITNCYYAGVVNGENAGGVCGVNSGSITNCYHTGAVSGTYAGGVCGSNSSSGNITNCYYETMDGIAGGIKGSDVTGKAEGKATKEFSDGVVAYLLSHGSIDGSIWGQTLSVEGQQAYPVLGGTTVYRICKNGSASYSNHEGDNEHLYDNGICSGCGVYKVPAYENDCYQIANKGNLYWFAGLVNGDASVCTGGVTQNTSASAVLTQDITVNTGVLDGGGKLTTNPSSFTGWIPIGNLINDKHIMYTGTFDGKGHTISGLYYAGSTSRLGFFGYVGRGGSVSNVGIVDSYFSGGTYAGGVCGDNYGTIKNCYYAGAVSGTNAGGVCGRNSGSITNCYHTGAVSGTYAGGVCGDNSGSITNCYHTGAVSGTNTGGVCGRNSGSITNCYYETMDGITGGIDGSDVTGKAQGKATKEFSDGVVAYLLSHGSIDGSIWGQTLTGETKQAYPVLGGAAVYTVCKNGSASYANHEGDNEHQYDNGICSGCGVYEVPVYKDECYQIANKGNLYWFAGLVNGDIRICTGDIKQDTSAKAVLTQDITVNTGVLDANGELAESETGFTSWTPIGNETKPYTGTFDGKGCKIEGLYFKDTSAESVGLFGRIGDGEGVCICNVGIVDSYLHGKSEVGGICGQSYRSTITNCYHTGSVRGNSSVGGVCGYNYYSTITNCYHTGLVSGTTTSVGGVCGRSENNNNFTNCYYETMDGITGGIKGSDVTGKAEGKITERFNDGEVAYLLSRGCTYDGIYYDGSAWGQNLTGEGQQAYPVFGGPKVYLKGTYTGCECNPGEPTSTDGYSNNKEDTVYSEHTMTAHSANNATCTKDGNLAYWTCSNGEGLYYKDEAGTEKYNNYEDDIKLPATGHTDEDLDGKCDTCDTYLDGIGARLAGHSLTLDGSVGVNFYMELSSEVTDDSSAYMEFTLPGGKTSTVKVSEAPTEVISGTTYYKFKCQVNATAMTDTITAQIKSTVGNSKVYEYTVKEYADYLFEHKNENTEFVKAAELIEAMVNYGSYAQIYAGYNTEKLAVGDAKNLKSLDDVWITAYYEPSIYEKKVQFAGANLSLLSTTTLRMYFKITDIDAESVLIGYQGQPLEKTQSGDYYYVELVGIPASKLDDEFVIDVDDGSTNFQVIYSPMAYCTSVVTRATTETRTEDLKNLMKALVLYNRAADAYMSNSENQ